MLKGIFAICVGAMLSCGASAQQLHNVQSQDCRKTVTQEDVLFEASALGSTHATQILNVEQVEVYCYALVKTSGGTGYGTIQWFSTINPFGKPHTEFSYHENAEAFFHPCRGNMETDPARAKLPQCISWRLR